MKTYGILPLRFGSGRFRGKPPAVPAGKPPSPRAVRAGKMREARLRK